MISLRVWLFSIQEGPIKKKKIAPKKKVLTTADTVAGGAVKSILRV